jgi:hypothetical protein
LLPITLKTLFLLMAHPYYSEEELIAREKKKPGQWWSSVQTGWWREEAIGAAIQSMDSLLIGNLAAPHRKAVVQDFQRKWATRLDGRLRFDRVESVQVSSDTLMSEFALCFWRHVKDADDSELRWTYRHYGSWKDNSYNLILTTKIFSMDLARSIFGEACCAPRQWANAGVYNPNPVRGPVSGGRIHMIASKQSPISVSVRPVLSQTISLVRH